jgi:tetratricopeptide (TPR) repeat protein
VGTTDNSLKLIFNQLINGNLGMAIAETETYLAAWPNPQTLEKLNDLKAEYQLMEEHWIQGTEDPMRADLYQRLLQRLYVLVANISIHKHMNGSSYLQAIYKGVRQEGRKWSMSSIKAEMENFVSEVAMLSLEPEHKQKEKSKTIYQQHQLEMNALFNYVLTTHMWTNSVGQGMEDMLLSPTIDTNDQQLLVSAITLSLMNRFDIVKFRTLTNVYVQSLDENVKQRALVGWALAIDDDWIKVYPEMQDIVNGLLKDEKVVDELTELQMQLIYTTDVQNDATKMRNEIMPDLIANNPVKFTKEGLVEAEDDPMEDVLHPDAAEQRMEKLEGTIRRMMDMQSKGADIYFDGFSKMKRYPFFYDMSNWFVPFYIQHPDIAQYVEKMEGFNLMKMGVEGGGTFCNSDKYSFLIVFQQMMNTLPDSLLQMLKRGEGALSMMNEMSKEEQAKPAFIRRNYLMDLYRFFMLFPNNKSLYNPYNSHEEEQTDVVFIVSDLFMHTPMDRHKPAIVKMLKKRKMNKSLALLMQSFPEEMRDQNYYLWMEDYERALEIDPENEWALVGHARSRFKAKDYEGALEIYEHLLLKYPEKRNYMLNKAVCQVNMEDYEEAQKVLYQLNYEHPEDMSVAHVLAWSLTCDGKMEQAENLYQQLMAQEAPNPSDFLNYGYSLWLQGRINEAAEQLRKYARQVAGNENTATLQLDDSWLKARGISETEICMMKTLVAMG